MQLCVGIREEASCLWRMDMQLGYVGSKLRDQAGHATMSGSEGKLHVEGGHPTGSGGVVSQGLTFN